MAGLGDITGFIAEREGFTPRAAWDYAQYTNGYGTKALHPGEQIDRAEAQRRLDREVAQARAIVEAHAPHADEGTKQALTSLTFNAGDKWTRSGLGQAIQSGDMDRARSLFLQYNKAGGEVLPGLVSRRQQEAALFGNPLSESMPQLANANVQSDYFSDKPISLTSDQIMTPPMALGGPKELNDTPSPNLQGNLESSEPFNAKDYRTSALRQKSHEPEWVQGPLGLMPKWSDGDMALQGFAGGGEVAGLGGMKQPHAGPLHSEVAGRTDHLPIEVTAGSFVVPADVISGLGEGNTSAGMKVLGELFPAQAPRLEFARGGAVPIMAAGGEFVLSPEQVAAVGGGDLNAGHDALDAWVVGVRNNTIKTLMALPPPVKD